MCVYICVCVCHIKAGYWCNEKVQVFVFYFGDKKVKLNQLYTLISPCVLVKINSTVFVCFTANILHETYCYASLR